MCPIGKTTVFALKKMGWKILYCFVIKRYFENLRPGISWGDLNAPFPGFTLYVSALWPEPYRCHGLIMWSLIVSDVGVTTETPMHCLFTIWSQRDITHQWLLSDSFWLFFWLDSYGLILTLPDSDRVILQFSLYLYDSLVLYLSCSFWIETSTRLQRVTVH
jgi:hypothetical protein